MCKQSRPLEKEQSQPAEWEDFLREVTFTTGGREIPFDPSVLGRMGDSSLCFSDLQQARTDNTSFSDDRFNTIKLLALKKLSGRTQEIFLFVLSNDRSILECARLLNLSDDTVRRHLESAISKLREILRSVPRPFPTAAGSRPVVRCRLFPLDTPDEQILFQEFCNEHPILHCSLSHSPPLREALVLYMSGKSKRKFNCSSKRVTGRARGLEPPTDRADHQPSNPNRKGHVC